MLVPHWVDAGDSSLLLRRQVYYLWRIRKQPRKVWNSAFGKANLRSVLKFSILSPFLMYWKVFHDQGTHIQITVKLSIRQGVVSL